MIEEELEKLKAQCEEYLNGWKRAKADLVNLQKQTERERAEWFMYANANCVKAMLPVVDSLEAAQVPGIEKVRDQMTETLRAMGVEQIKSVGEPVNPELHEVVGTEKSETPASPADVHASASLGSVAPEDSAGRHAPDVIVKEAQRGYTMHGKVLRAAKVIVSE